MTRASPSGLPPGAAFARGTAVAIGARGLLITGPSGAGKSSLALELISRGARLVGDDGVTLLREGRALIAAAPPAMQGLIEARGMGILRAPHAPRAELKAIVDLSREESERLPPERWTELRGVRLRLLHKALNPSFAAALHVYLVGDDE